MRLILQSCFTFVAVVTAFVLASVQAPAQDESPVWQRGEILTNGSGGLELIAQNQERTFTIADSGKELKFRFLRLSGEREHKLAFTGKTDRSQTFTGDGTRLTITAATPDTIVAEFETFNESRGLAFLEVTSNEEITTGTLVVDSQGIFFQTPESQIYIRGAGAQAFRDKLQNGYRVVLPIDQNMKVRIAVSTREIEEAELETIQLSLAESKMENGVNPPRPSS